MPEAIIGIIVFLTVLFLSILIFIAVRTKKCPADKIMVIYGRVGKYKDGKNRPAVCIHGGARFIIPVIQSYGFLDLAPISIHADLRKALSRNQARLDILSVFTVAVSTEDGVMQNAAERLFGMERHDVAELAKDLILSQLRLIVAMQDIEEIHADRNKFLESVYAGAEAELRKVGLKLINVNIADITCESGHAPGFCKEGPALTA